MECPECEDKTKVIDSRKTEVMYRRRECRSCKHRFSTYEVTQYSLLEMLDDKLPVELVDQVSNVLEKEFPTDTRRAKYENV
ncbi:hypothetical protein QGM71_01145 [Virgibacillus sp. C22-A2]|uniref:Transcriptional repressor NrdR-like N-terminal domain-containing protein n=1 Tax=Virgibacillus tibetensis TaxID=3042313 RepID=A0ABU6K9U5_9BACI|nr:hypothetical protein [Virgibacillus sp. C22-A2]